jgi:predicted glycosyltransferase involved in capsule biosynthesis
MLDKDITFIITYQQDTPERLANLKIVLPYYQSIFPDATFTIIESGENTLEGNLKDDIAYNFIESQNGFNKSKLYNIGLKCCETQFVCFLDIDCVVSRENLIKAFNLSSKHTKNIFIGYNGTSIYFKYNVKNKITECLNLYSFLDTFIDKDKLFLNFSNDNYLVGNTRAVGGCLCGKTEAFLNINGFNPNIIGWGFEDNEIVTRSHILGYSPLFVNTEKPLLFHLPHYNEETDKSLHPFYLSNQAIFNKVKGSKKEDLLKYSSSWKLT